MNQSDTPAKVGSMEGLGLDQKAALVDALGAYWNAAYAEGAEGRVHDTEDGAAQRALFAVQEAVNAVVATELERLICELRALLNDKPHSRPNVRAKPPAGSA